MDGIHDLGGMQGFGPVAADHEHRPFAAEWEKRAFAIVSSLPLPDVTLEWWRHVRELTPPAEYLTTPYFASCAMTQAAVMIERGDLTLDEIATTARALAAGTDPGAEVDAVAPPPDGRSVAMIAVPPCRSDHPADRPARYAVGEPVAAHERGHPGHTRLPRYIRGALGEVVIHHGAHLLADSRARGESRGEHLYTVAFRRAEVFPSVRGSADRLMLDLWESYLDPA